MQLNEQKYAIWPFLATSNIWLVYRITEYPKILIYDVDFVKRYKIWCLGVLYTIQVLEIVKNTETDIFSHHSLSSM